jgi:hypothetical protein
MSKAVLERPSPVVSAAVVWLNHRDAVVARSVAGRETVVSIERGPIEAEPTFLNRILHEIGDRDRIVILGPGEARLELERSYTSLYRRPERLVDVELSGPLWAEDLLARARELSGREDESPRADRARSPD